MVKTNLPHGFVSSSEETTLGRGNAIHVLEFFVRCTPTSDLGSGIVRVDIVFSACGGVRVVLAPGTSEKLVPAPAV